MAVEAVVAVVAPAEMAQTAASVAGRTMGTKVGAAEDSAQLVVVKEAFLRTELRRHRTIW